MCLLVRWVTDANHSADQHIKTNEPVTGGHGSENSAGWQASGPSASSTAIRMKTQTPSTTSKVSLDFITKAFISESTEQAADSIPALLPDSDALNWVGSSLSENAKLVSEQNLET